MRTARSAKVPSVGVRLSSVLSPQSSVLNMPENISDCLSCYLKHIPFCQIIPPVYLQCQPCLWIGECFYWNPCLGLQWWPHWDPFPKSKYFKLSKPDQNDKTGPEILLTAHATSLTKEPCLAFVAVEQPSIFKPCQKFTASPHSLATWCSNRKQVCWKTFIEVHTLEIQLERQRFKRWYNVFEIKIVYTNDFHKQIPIQRTLTTFTLTLTLTIFTFITIYNMYNIKGQSQDISQVWCHFSGKISENTKN